MSNGVIDGQKYQRFLPEHLQRSYEEGLSDPEILHLRQEISLMDVRVKALLGTLDREVMDDEDVKKELRERFSFLSDDESSQIASYIVELLPEHFVNNMTFSSLETYVRSYEDNIVKRNLRVAESSLNLLFRNIRERRKQGDVWDEVRAAMETRRRLVETEQKRQESAGRMITVDKVVALLAFTIESLRESVTRYIIDEEIREYIFTDAERVYQRHLSAGEDPSRDTNGVDGKHTI